MQLSLEDGFPTKLWRFFSSIGIFCAFHGFCVEHDLLFVIKINHRREQRFIYKVVQCALLAIIIRKYNAIYKNKMKT